MSEQTQSGYGSLATGGASQESNGASVKDKAAESAQAGRQAAGEVARTAAGQAKQVAAEAQSQARNLVGEARDRLRSRAGDQHRNAVTKLRSLGDQLHSMASSSEQGGVATDLVHQAGDRTQGVADWLDGRRPEELLDELRRVARRRPGVFLLGALAAGVVAGRLTRGAVAAHSDDSGSGTAHALPASGDTTRYAGSVGGDQADQADQADQGDQADQADRADRAEAPYRTAAAGPSYGAETVWESGSVEPTVGGGAA